jgi:hypothetical protein
MQVVVSVRYFLLCRGDWPQKTIFQASVVSMMNYRNIAQQFFVPVDFQLKMHSWAMWLKLKINRRGKGQARCDNSALTRH